MQVLIDTETDKPNALYELGKWLVSMYSTPAAAPSPVAPPASAPAPVVPVWPANAAPVSLPAIPAPPGPAPAPELDSAGTPWDRSKHTSTKARLLDGTWKLRKPRGNEPVAVPTPTPPPAVTPPPVPPPPVSLPADDGDDEDVTVESDDVPAPMEVAALTFEMFIPRVTSAMAAGTLTQETIAQVQQKHGILSLFSLSADPAKLQEVARDFGLAA